jgi:hypothetical protein
MTRHDIFTQEELREWVDSFDAKALVQEITDQIMAAKADPLYEATVDLNALAELAPDLLHFHQRAEVAHIVERKLVGPFMFVLESDDENALELAKCKMARERLESLETVAESYDPDQDDTNPLFRFDRTGEDTRPAKTAARKSVETHDSIDPRESDWLKGRHPAEASYSKATASLNKWWSSLTPAKTAHALMSKRAAQSRFPQYGANDAKAYEDTHNDATRMSQLLIDKAMQKKPATDQGPRRTPLLDLFKGL